MERDEWENHQYEQLTLFDKSTFRLVMDGIYASIRLNKMKPDRGMTREEAEERLKRWFPEAQITIDGEPIEGYNNDSP